MYYEEIMLGGKLMCRTDPNGKWEECSIDKAWSKITELQDEITDLRACMRTVTNMLGGHVNPK